MTAPIIHIEWKSANFARTSEFYARVFKWKTEQNGSGSYMKLDGADGPSVGWVRADLVQAPGPVNFLPVDDLAATLDEIESAGGRVLVRSLPFAGGGEIRALRRSRRQRPRALATQGRAGRRRRREARRGRRRRSEAGGEARGQGTEGAGQAQKAQVTSK